MSAGCTNCYAMRMAARLDAMGVEKYTGLTRKSGGRAKWTGSLRFDEAALTIPEKWAKPRNVFVNSMSDLFHPDVPTSFIRQIWDTMGRTQRHTYQILTKRPDRMAHVLSDGFEVLPNVWLGASVEDARVLHRLDELRQVPAAVRFVSFEPLIGSVSGGKLDNIQWAIVGGESGPNARPVDPTWIDEIFDMCTDAGSAFFFKQWGGKNKKATGRSYRGKTWNEMPAAHAA
jgi:protein gp37